MGIFTKALGSGNLSEVYGILEKLFVSLSEREFFRRKNESIKNYESEIFLTTNF